MHLLSDDIDELRLCFQTVDTDNIGSINVNILELILEQIGYHLEQDPPFSQICSKYCDENRNMNFDTIIRMIENENIVKCEELIIGKVFKLFDPELQGKIGHKELIKISQELGLNLSATDIDVMIREADINQDGFVDLFEFGKLMERIRACEDVQIS